MSVEALRELPLIAKIGIFVVAIVVSLVATSYLWARFTVSGNIHDMKRTGVNGAARQRLLKLGSVAMPALLEEDRRLIAEHRDLLRSLRLSEDLNPGEHLRAGYARVREIEDEEGTLREVINAIEARQRR